MKSNNVIKNFMAPTFNLATFWRRRREKKESSLHVIMRFHFSTESKKKFLYGQSESDYEKKTKWETPKATTNCLYTSININQTNRNFLSLFQLFHVFPLSSESEWEESEETFILVFFREIKRKRE